VWHLNPNDFPEPHRVQGRWLGVAHNVGQALCYWILTNTGQVLARSTVQPVTDDEIAHPVSKKQLDEFDVELNERLNRGHPHNTFIKDAPKSRLFNDHEEDYEPVDIEGLKPEIESFDPDAYDRLLFSKVMLPHGDHLESARVTKRLKDDNGNPIGRAHNNPILDDRM
jgi:hypothetical protein